DKLTEYRKWLLSITICDPACGSGAFLNAALDFLINEHKLIDEMTKKLLGHSIEFPNIENAILENNLYGVDINEESVEIAKLALWLRTAKPQRKLNSLNNNIKCGNSLISDPRVAGEKAFDWHREFPQVFEKGGFDVVIGNPPYVLCQPSNTNENVLNYYKQYEVASYKIDLFHLFFEQGVKLLKHKGKLGYITPNTYLTNKYIKPLREFILNNTDIISLVQHDETVFVDASVDVATIILSKQKEAENNVLLLKSSDNFFIEIGYKNQKDWNQNVDCIFNIKSDFDIDITNCVQLGEICNTYFGIQAFDRKSSISNTKENEHFLEIIDGGDIYPYSYAVPTKYFNYVENNIKSGGDWKVYEQERIVIRQIGQIPIVGMSRKNILASNTLYSVYSKTNDYQLQYILCILNSSVIKKYWLSKYSDSKQLFPKIKGYQLRELPIKAISLTEQQPFIALADQMLSLNADLQAKRQRFLKRLSDNFAGIKITGTLERFDELEFKQLVAELKKQKNTLSLKQQDEWEEYFNEYQSECRNFVRQIEATDKEIDRMVYALYRLTEEEVGIINRTT
ncbi:MAG: N-6 DNA methylase, partial [Prevotella sp.]|nr:N-6 DNA methylase [Prevotella sp.]